MNASDRHHEPGGYERTDARPGATVRGGLYILGTMFLTAAVLVPLFRFFGRRERAEQRPAATVLAPSARAPEPAFPRLVTSEPAVLARFRSQEDALLTSWGWVEKDRGIARMPIEEAMKIVAARGLPSFPAPAPTPAPKGRVPAKVPGTTLVPGGGAR
jgi:hypothetical protein